MPTAARVRQAVRASSNLPVTWCVLGFLAGAVFWHFVGFWGFISEAVLAGNTSQERSAAHANGAASSASVNRHNTQREMPAPAARQSSCAVLALNRSTGETIQSACPAGVWHHRHNGLAQRQDLEPTTQREHIKTGVAGWSTRIEDLGADLSIR